MTALLEIDGLRVELPVGKKLKTVVRGVSFAIAEREALAVVGESGSGKSMTARSVMRLLPLGARTSGVIQFKGQSVGEMDQRALRRYRAKDVGMIFQDPRAHINAVRTVGDFLTEALISTQSMNSKEAVQRVTGLLDEVGVSRAQQRLRQYPYELSGGLLQRVMIASVLAVEPSLILADEPTTALDVTTQSDVMSILDEARQERDMGMLFITHDLDLAAAVSDRTVVMYAGTVLEEQSSSRLHEAPMHPYSAALIASRPSLHERTGRLNLIPGRPQSASEAPEGCPFAPRCKFRKDICASAPTEPPPLPGGRSGCVRAEELGLIFPNQAEQDPSG